MPQAKNITKHIQQHQYLFSICTMVTDVAEYNVMKESFESCGFADDCEYLIADNTQSNSFDAYEAINLFIQQSQGKYIVVVHQDVRCIDHRSTLKNCLEDVEKLDDKWAVCGNAGSAGYHDDIIYLTNNNTIAKTINLPAKAISLDENFLVVKAGTPVFVSPDIKGFHLYGTDIALNADFLGYNCYIIPFMVKHLSMGNLAELDKYRHSFINNYGRKFRSRYIETSCTKFYLSNSVSKNKLLNLPLPFFFIKVKQRIKQVFNFAKKGKPHPKTIVPEK